MKKLQELGISPAPWNIKYSEFSPECGGGRVVGGIVSRNGCTRVDLNIGIADARLIAASPKLYGKAYEIAENLRIHLAVPTQSITLNRTEVEAMAKELEDVLAEAAGEREVRP